MIRDALNIAKIHLDRLQKAKREIEIKNIDTMDLEDFENVKLVDTTEEWVKIRQLRNKIAHEYPDEQEEIINDIKEAIKKVDYLAKVYKNIKDFLIKRRLL